MRPAPPADRETLLRRVTFDLTGLPPTPAELDAFLADDSPDAFEKVVDRLLASPHSASAGAGTGSTWSATPRVAGTSSITPMPNAYQYRDYVIRAFNADVPYDQFVARAHCRRPAAEAAAATRPTAFNESILGTGFWLLGERSIRRSISAQDQADRFDNMIDVFSKTFLGLTVACARCHDHKFDAITTQDYYALFGVLEGTSPRLVRFDGREQNRQVAERLAELRQRREPALRSALARQLRPTADRFADLLRAAAMVRTGIRPEAAAESFQVDAAAVAAWAEELKAAAKDERHPLHVWAVLADAKDFPAARKELLDAARKRDRCGGSRPRTVLRSSSITRNRGPGDWLPDDVTFGPGPVAVGGLLYSKDAGRPVRGIATEAAARFDPVWTGITDAPASEQESGDLAYPRAGRIDPHPLVRGRAAEALFPGPRHRPGVRLLSTVTR